MPKDEDQIKTVFYDPFTARSRRNTFDNVILKNPWEPKNDVKNEPEEASTDKKNDHAD